MVDERRVERLLRRIGGDVERLRTTGAVAGLIGDEVRLAAIKYHFVTAIEASLNVAHHLAASEGWEVPATSADAFRVLARHQVIERELAAKLALAAGFRNLLVHEYAEVDDRIVVGNLDRLEDLDAFIASVTAWMDNQGPTRV